MDHAGPSYISYCPEGTTRLAWLNFPTLHILNNPSINRVKPDETKQDGSETVGDRITNPSITNITGEEGCINAQGSAITVHRPLPEIDLGLYRILAEEYTLSGMRPANKLGLTTPILPRLLQASPSSLVGVAIFTYSPLTMTKPNRGWTEQPSGYVFSDDGIINGTMAVMLTDLDLFETPFNTTQLNPRIVALGLYMAG